MCGLSFVTPLLPLSVIVYSMESAALPLISSFIIRFVSDETPARPNAYHGTIRHIQTAEEINFHQWCEATEFMHRFVHLDEFQPPSTAENPEESLPNQ